MLISIGGLTVRDPPTHPAPTGKTGVAVHGLVDCSHHDPGEHGAGWKISSVQDSGRDFGLMTPSQAVLSRLTHPLNRISGQPHKVTAKQLTEAAKRPVRLPISSGLYHEPITY